MRQALRTRWPPVKIIVTSGYQQVSPERLPKGSLFLSKPYDPEQVRQKIATLLTSG
jgi:two-component system, response regulator PdtaR